MKLWRIVACGAIVTALVSVVSAQSGAATRTEPNDRREVIEPDAAARAAAAELMREHHAVVAPAAANKWGTATVVAAATPSASGCWVAQANGTVATLAAAPYKGGVDYLPLNGPIVGMSPSATGNGYWLVATDGGIFSLGDAKFYGSMGAVRLNAPVFSMAPTKGGGGYWLVAFDGGIFSFGNAKFYGSMGAVRLNAPVNGLFVSPTGKGYGMVAHDGGVFNFGDSVFYGSLGGQGINNIVGLAPTPTGKGYWLLGADNRVYRFGDAPPITIGDDYLSEWSEVAGIVTNPVAPGFRIAYKGGFLSQAYGADPCNLAADPRWSNQVVQGAGGVYEVTFPLPANAEMVALEAFVNGVPQGSTGPATWCLDALRGIAGADIVEVFETSPGQGAAHVSYPTTTMHGDCAMAGYLHLYNANQNYIDSVFFQL